MLTESMVLVFRGTLRGHEAMVTSIAIPANKDSNVIMSSSRDKTLILWHLSKDVNSYGVLLRRLTGHSHFVSDVALASDARFALSASWDGELRLWDLATLDMPTRRFVGHTKDILSVTLFGDHAIVSGSRDRTLKLWNIYGNCICSTDEMEIDGHTDWVSCVRFSLEMEDTTVARLVSGSWDGTVRVWELDKVLGLKKRFTLTGHEGYLNAVALSPDGSLLASGGKDGVVFLWDMANGKKIYEIETGFIHALSFCPEYYLLCVAADDSIKVWDLNTKETVQELKVTLNTDDNNGHVNGGSGITTNNNNQNIYCTCLNWSADGSTLFSGYIDGVIRVWELICQDSQ